MFTDIFPSRKLKKAQTDDVALDEADRAIAASEPASVARSRRKPDFRPSHHGQTPDPPYETEEAKASVISGSREKKSGFQKPKSNFSNDGRHVLRLSIINYPYLPVISPLPGVDGRLRLFASA